MFEPLAFLGGMAANKLMGGKKPDSGPQFSKPDYTPVIDLLKSQQSKAGLTETVMPSIMALLSPGGQGSKPFEAAIEANTNRNVAQMQTDMMKRNMTGSDIELAGMGAERAAGGQALSEMYGRNAMGLSQLMYQAASSDFNSQKENLYMLAQAMGQQIGGEQDLMMFQQSLKASLDQAAKNRSSSLWGSAIGAAGMIGGAYLGGPAGAAVGSSLGNSLGQSIGGGGGPSGPRGMAYNGQTESGGWGGR